MAGSAMPKNKKIQLSGGHPPKKQTRIVEEVSLYKLSPKWSFAKMDIEHQEWGLLANEKYLGGMLVRFREWERLKWEDILTTTAGRKHNTQSHPMPIEILCREAKARLAQLRLDSYAILYSLAITGRQRVWGIMIEETGTFQLLWYDPEHTVYPVSM